MDPAASAAEDLGKDVAAAAAAAAADTTAVADTATVADTAAVAAAVFGRPGDIVAVLVGCKWYSSKMDPCIYRSANARSVDPRFLYCDLNMESPIAKTDCNASFNPCQNALSQLMPNLAGVLSFEFLLDLEHNKSFYPETHNPLLQDTFLLDGRRCPWLKGTVIKEMLNTSNPFETSPMFEFGKCIDLMKRKDPVNEYTYIK